MERSDFDNNIDWVVYKVTGRMPVNTNTVELVNHQLPSSERKNDLKFYHNGQNGRFGCLYKNTFVCACEENEIRNVQRHFDKMFNGNNLEEVRESLRDKYNLAKRNQTYKNGILRFSRRDNDRLTATINHNRKTHTICSCHQSQKEEVTKRFNTLRKTRSLESIKETMKREYNIGKKPTLRSGTITIDMNGAIYKDGKFCKTDPSFYEFVDAFTKK